ncbi:MAG: alpha/beta hydrolase [Candidatus Tectomicrobia bacterium]|nr:alpha/beta hydrolase [Candidatus Tectomicrobia bacterium]
MSIYPLPPQPPMSDLAEQYAAKALADSRIAQTTVKTVLDIEFGDNYWQKLDLYLPDSPPEKGCPVLAFIHGGGWSHGYKEWMGFMAPPFTQANTIFISVGYRLAPEAMYPAPVEDCQNALLWIHRHIANYGGDPDRIFVGGHSAGGHLCSLITLDRRWWAKHHLPDDFIKGCFPISGVFDLRIEGGREKLAPLLQDDTVRGVASPILYVEGNRVPFVIAVGDRDTPYLQSQAKVLVEALKQQGSKVTYIVFENADHFDASLEGGNGSGRWVPHILEWMNASPK